MEAYTADSYSFDWTASENYCGGEIFSDMGTIMSPNYPEPYNKNRRCEWSITVNQNRLVNLKFTDWDIRKSDSCLEHFVQVFDGHFGFSPPLSDRLCSSSTPEEIKSHGNKMKVVFETNEDNSGERGFKAVFSSDDIRICGGDFDLAPTEHDILIQEILKKYKTSNHRLKSPEAPVLT